MNGEETDVEALQAQIDLSNSVAYDLVSSWMKPIPSETSITSASIARELEEYAKRPPRLGLGASVSKASVATTREAATLKGKLVGTKRTRNESGVEVSMSVAGRPQEEDDEDESRSAAISSKNVVINGTGKLTSGLGTKDKGKGKAATAPASGLKEVESESSSNESGGQKKKRRKQEGECRSKNETDSQLLATPSTLNPFVTPRSPLTRPFVINPITLSPIRTASSSETSSSPNKNKKPEKQKEVFETELDEEWHGLSLDTTVLLDLVHNQNKKSQENRLQASMPSNLPIGRSRTSAPVSAIDLISPVRKTFPPSRKQHLDYQNRSVNSTDLEGSPSQNTTTVFTEDDGRMAATLKRKKARRRGKRRRSRTGKEGGLT